MGTGHGQHMAALQHVLGQPLRAAGVRQPLVQDSLHQRVTRAAIGQTRPRNHIAHDEHIGRKAGLAQDRGVIAFGQVNAQLTQLIAHGRVYAGVATGDPVAGLTRQGR